MPHQTLDLGLDRTTEVSNQPSTAQTISPLQMHSQWKHFKTLKEIMRPSFSKPSSASISHWDSNPCSCDPSLLASHHVLFLVISFNLPKAIPRRKGLHAEERKARSKQTPNHTIVTVGWLRRLKPDCLETVSPLHLTINSWILWTFYLFLNFLNCSIDEGRCAG